jgi:hypothetical protein
MLSTSFHFATPFKLAFVLCHSLLCGTWSGSFPEQMKVICPLPPHIFLYAGEKTHILIDREDFQSAHKVYPEKIVEFVVVARVLVFANPGAQVDARRRAVFVDPYLFSILKDVLGISCSFNAETHYKIRVSLNS